MRTIEKLRWPWRVRWRSRSARAPSRPLNVVTTTEDLASIVREVGGDKVRVESLAKGYQDPALRRSQAELHPAS